MKIKYKKYYNGIGLYVFELIIEGGLMIGYIKYSTFLFGCLGLTTTVFTDEVPHQRGGALDKISLTLSSSWLATDTERDFKYYSQSNRGDTWDISQPLTFSQKNDSAAARMLGVEYRLMSAGSVEFSLTLDVASFETKVKSDSAIANSIAIDIKKSALMAGLKVYKPIVFFGRDAYIGVFAKHGLNVISDEMSEVSFEMAAYATEKNALEVGHVFDERNTYLLSNPDIDGWDYNFDGDFTDPGVDYNDNDDYTERKYLADRQVSIDYNGDGDTDDSSTGDIDGDGRVAYTLLSELYVLEYGEVIVPLPNNTNTQDLYDNTELWENGNFVGPADGLVDYDSPLGGDPDGQPDFTPIRPSSTNMNNLFIWEGNLYAGVPVDFNGDDDTTDVGALYFEFGYDFDFSGDTPQTDFNNDGDTNDYYFSEVLDISIADYDPVLGSVVKFGGVYVLGNTIPTWTTASGDEVNLLMDRDQNGVVDDTFFYSTQSSFLGSELGISVYQDNDTLSEDDGTLALVDQDILLGIYNGIQAIPDVTVEDGLQYSMYKLNPATLTYVEVAGIDTSGEVPFIQLTATVESLSTSTMTC